MNSNSCQTVFYSSSRKIFLFYKGWKHSQNFNGSRQDTHCCTTAGFTVTKTLKINETSTPHPKLTRKDSKRSSTTPPLCEEDFSYCNSGVKEPLFNSVLLF